MSVSEGFATVSGKTISVRLHVHEDPDPDRSEYRGGPKGGGYIEGPMAEIEHLANQKPVELVIHNAANVPLKTLEKITWQEAEVMWTQGDYVHGIVHLEWQ
jgi:hypothetical protein